MTDVWNKWWKWANSEKRHVCWDTQERLSEGNISFIANWNKWKTNLFPHHGSSPTRAAPSPRVLNSWSVGGLVVEGPQPPLIASRWRHQYPDQPVRMTRLTNKGNDAKTKSDWSLPRRHGCCPPTVIFCRVFEIIFAIIFWDNDKWEGYHEIENIV